MVRAAVWEARTDWMNIGIELNLMKTDLDAIKADYSDSKSCFTEMLTLWLKQVDPPPTWSSLVTALKKPTTGHEKVAEQIDIVVTDLKNVSTEAANLLFPHIKKVAPNKHAREELEQKLRMESRDIMREFHILRHKFFDSIEEQNIAVHKLVEYLEDELSDCLPKRDVDSEPMTLKEVKQLIKQNSSFYDYQLIKYMIKLTGTDKDKDQLKLYEEAFSAYAKRRIYECPSKFCTSGDADSELHVKLDSMYDGHTLEELKNLQYRLCSILHISVYVCRLESNKEGCILLTLLIPCHLQEVVFPLSDEQKKVLVKLGVHKLSCGSYQFTRNDDHQVTLYLNNVSCSLK